MAAHINQAYLQHPAGAGKRYPVAHANPAYFQPGYLESAVRGGTGIHGRKKRAGKTKHGKAGAHARDTMTVHMRDPYRGRGAARQRGR